MSHQFICSQLRDTSADGLQKEKVPLLLEEGEKTLIMSSLN